MTILQKRIEASLTYNGQKIYFISINILNFTNVLMQRVNSILIRGEVYSIHRCLITIQICRDLLTCRWNSPSILVSSTNKIGYRDDITEIFFFKAPAHTLNYLN